MIPTQQIQELYRSRDEVFLGEIDRNHVAEVIDQLADLKRQGKPLCLVISSPGGVTNAGFDLAQFIEQELQSEVDARIWGRCSSAATYALLCCKKRIAHPEAVFVIHRQTSSIELEYTDNFENRVEEWRRSNAFTHQRQIDFYARKLKLDAEKVVALLDKGMGIDAELSAKEALELGLITEISSLR